MTTLVPRGYGGFPSFQFSPPNQIHNQYYNGRYPSRDAFFAPHYPTQPLYQPPFNPVQGYPSPAINTVQRPGLGAQFEMFINQLDEQLRYEQYSRKLEKMQKTYWKQQANTMPLPMYPAPTLPMSYDPSTVYEYEKETRYIPFPIYLNAGAGSSGAGINLGYGTGSNLNFGTSGGMSLPPKVRVIFIPTGQSFSQQSYTGSLAMPPFLYNRISQPLCSFPLPPPLPQLGSLSLTPAVQQMVMQRYSNPVAVLPMAPNWQIPQLMMPNYPLFSQQQQQQQLMPSMSAFQSLPPPPQAYMSPPAYFSAPTSAMPSILPAPQMYFPPPASISAIPSFSSGPQTYFPPPAPPFAPLSAIQSLPPAPQSYIPPPFPIMPNNQFMQSPPSLQLPLQNTQYSYSGYPSTCRACPPAPPPLNIPVTGHCWVQHCSACHHVPTPISNPNIRPTGGRITPLLRHPAVPQYVPEQAIHQQQQQYFHANAPVMMRPWLRKTPPLPPGAVLISDEYFNKKGSYMPYDHSQRQQRQYERSSRAKYRSATVKTRTVPPTGSTAIKNHKSTSPTRTNKNNNNPTQHQEFTKPKSAKSSSSSSSTSSSGLSVEYEKVTLHSSRIKPDAIPQQLTREARNINVNYNYQPQELPSVYHINRYLKSSSETSTLSSNLETRSDCPPSFVREHRPVSSVSSRDSNSIKEESKFEKEDENSTRPLSQPKKPKEKLIIIREFMANSPSSISTISSTMEFSIINKDEDSISTTSTLKTNTIEEEDDGLRRHIF